MTNELKGQAWINVNEDGTKDLVQDVIIIDNSNGVTRSYDDVKVLVRDIWSGDNLLSDSEPSKSKEFNENYNYRWNGKKGNSAYYFWVYEMTDIGDPSITVNCFFECPKPDDGVVYNTSSGELIREKDDISNKGSYLYYWVDRFTEFKENYEKTSGIQKEVVIEQGSVVLGNPKAVTSAASPVSGESNTITYETRYKEIDNGLGDIQNLLSMF